MVSLDDDITFQNFLDIKANININSNLKEMLTSSIKNYESHVKDDPTFLCLTQKQYENYIKIIFYIGLILLGFPNFEPSTSTSPPHYTLIDLCEAIFRLAHKLQFVYLDSSKNKRNLFIEYLEFKKDNNHVSIKPKPSLSRMIGLDKFDSIKIKGHKDEFKITELKKEDRKQNPFFLLLNRFKCVKASVMRQDYPLTKNDGLAINAGLIMNHPITETNLKIPKTDTEISYWLFYDTIKFEKFDFSIFKLIYYSSDRKPSDNPKTKLGELGAAVGAVGDGIVRLLPRIPVKVEPKTSGGNIKKPKKKPVTKKPTKTSKKPPGTSRTSK